MRLTCLTALAATVVSVSCMDVVPISAPTATVHIALSAAAADVVGVEYTVSCASGESTTQYVTLEEEGLPIHLSNDLAGAPFADLFLVLEPGYCEVSATPMQSPVLPSEQCSPAFASGFITAEETAEWLLVIECEAPGAGAVDIVTTLNHIPTIDQIVLDPGDTIVQCSTLDFTVETSDLDGDDVSVSVDVVPPQEGADYGFVASLSGYKFQPKVSGTWTLIVIASDGTSESEAAVEITVTASSVACSGNDDSKS